MNNKYPVAIFKGAIASIPVVGSFAVELLNVTIPDQRQKRIEELLVILGSKISDLENKQLELKFGNDIFVDIFEDVLHQAIRATSKERLEYLASVIEYGLRQEEIEHLQIKRILKILAEINDVEIIILKSYQENIQGFEENYLPIFESSEISPEKLEEQETMLENYNSHLVNLGLIGKDDFLESRILITKLGVMLLKKIGIKQSGEILTGNPINPINAINSAYKKLNEREKEIRREIDLETKKSVKAIEDIVRRLSFR